MKTYNTTDNPRFRSQGGVIRSMAKDAISPRVTTTAARKMLNDFYMELCKHDPAAAERICQRVNA